TAVAFPNAPVVFPMGAIGSLSDSHLQTAADLNVPQSLQLHFVLTADSGQQTGASVRMTISDHEGNVLYQLLAADGDTTSFDVVLVAGVYTVTIDVVPPASGVVPPIGFTLGLFGVTDPIGVQGADTTSNPGGSGPPDPNSPPPPPP